MEKLSSNKIWIQYRDGILPMEPVLGRVYTMTHSDETADLFVTAGCRIAEDRVGAMRDEVILQFIRYKNKLILLGDVLVTVNNDKKNAEFRNDIFVKEMGTALKAIRNADRFLFESIDGLDETPVYIQYRSRLPQYNRTECYGVIGDYVIK